MTLVYLNLAGIDVPDTDALGLALLLRLQGYAECADSIESAYLRFEQNVAFSALDRKAVVSVLTDPSDGLVRLKEALVDGNGSRSATG